MNNSKILNPFVLFPASMALLILLSGIYNTFMVGFSVSEPNLDGMFPQTKLVRQEKRRTYKRAALRRRSKYKRKSHYKKIAQAPTQKTEVEKNEYAHIQDSLDLRLVEFFNSKHFDKVLRAKDVEGYLEASSGVIESLEINLPNNDQIIVENSRMNGNIFTYYHEGELYSGLMYQSGNSGYSISLVNGPYQGTKMKFVASSREISNFDEAEDEVAQEKPEESFKEEKFEEDEVGQNDQFLDEQEFSS